MISAKDVYTEIKSNNFIKLKLNDQTSLKCLTQRKFQKWKRFSMSLLATKSAQFLMPELKT